jgi:AcrR family transcriptional regulator
MPPKETYTRQDIIQAAFDIAREKGLHELTARKVAERLQCSTAPVYSHFQSMDELEREVIKRARDLLFEYATRPYTDRVFLNMGTGIVLFARDQSELFRILFLERRIFGDILAEFRRDLLEKMKADDPYAALPEADRNALLETMWIFTHGYASLICVGLVEETDQKQIIEKLDEVGSVIVTAATEAASEPGQP